MKPASLAAVLALLLFVPPPALAGDGLVFKPAEIPGDGIAVLVEITGGSFNSTSTLEIDGGASYLHSFGPDRLVARIAYTAGPGPATARVRVHTIHLNPGPTLDRGELIITDPGSTPLPTITITEITDPTSAPDQIVKALITHTDPITTEVGNLTTGDRVPHTPTSVPGGTELAASITGLLPGLNEFFIQVNIGSGPAEVSAFHFFTITRTVTSGARPLELPHYLVGTREVFQNAPQRGDVERFGGLPAASSACLCPCPESCAGVRHLSRAVSRADAGGTDINLFLGRFFWRLSCITLPGKSLPIDLQISINTQLRLPGTGYVLGKQWLHSYVRALFRGPGGSLIRVDGQMMRTDVFTPQADGTLTAPGWPGQIRKERYHPHEGLPTDGLLRRIEDGNLEINFLDLDYDISGAAARLATITDSFGRTGLTFAYDPDSGLLIAVTDLDGRTVKFAYDADLELASVTSPIGSVFTTGRSYRFGYTSGVLTSITYPNEVFHGIAAPRIVLDYETGGTLRVARQTWGGTNITGVAAGGTISYEYGVRADGTPFTLVKDRASNETVYEFRAAGWPRRSRRPAACARPARSSRPSATTATDTRRL